ncbi:uncharacterized protein LOC106693143 [Microplitis demolitor]|uniref:uncharacterized protein LOC106693143 n=1 Tax=Microplitis demolitor TaxID=69319 RepID=UPI00235B6C0E|nr:uncharacterized protein LOC106693143 [Microplitis demolitor]
MAATQEQRCVYCNENHQVYTCSKFAALTPYARYEASRNGGWCTNCLKRSHRSSKCTSQPCRNCKQRHHTLLHFEKGNNPSDQTNGLQVSSHFATSTTSMHTQSSSQAVLATAIVDFVNSQGKTKPCRVFLDAGSQAHFITEDVANFLNLVKKPTNIFVTGIDNTSTNVNFSARVTLRSRVSKYEKTTDFLIIPQISQTMPSITINQAALDIPKNIQLADPDFFRPSKVDALIGVKLFYKLLSVGQILLKNHPEAVLQKTQLGWIVAGEFNQFPQAASVSCHMAVQSDPPDVNLTRFWELEELSDAVVLSPEEKTCEEHYSRYTKRNADGRYEVRLPFNNKKSALGESYSSALRRFYALERKFQQKPDVRDDYVTFLNEYISLGHMSLANDQEAKNKGFFLPHHAVLKEDNVTTKVRVVFDGSARTSTGVSLNDTLMFGPKLQDDLFIILMRFRSHTYVLTADAEKMYRQVRVNYDDAQYQKILYRAYSIEPIQTYVLNTATYGTTSASYLAIKTLFKLAEDEQNNFPIAAQVLRRDFYVDD